MCDFALAGGGESPDRGLAPACAGSYSRRTRPLCWGSEDAADLLTLREELLALLSEGLTGGG